jgi:hypothetical protein
MMSDPLGLLSYSCLVKGFMQHPNGKSDLVFRFQIQFLAMTDENSAFRDGKDRIAK